MSKVIYCDRSRVTDTERCMRLRYLRYQYGGVGLEREGDLKLDARIGTWVHHGIETGLTCAKGFKAGEFEAQVAEDAGADFVTDCLKVTSGQILSDQLNYDIGEGQWIVTALVYAWLRLRAPRMLWDGDILAVEKEITVDFHMGSAGYHAKSTADCEINALMPIVRLMARPDIIWRRKSDGTIFIRNLKTVRKPDDRWREKWPLDMQTLSEPLAVDKWLHDFFWNIGGINPKPYGPQSEPDTCGGVIIDGLTTGVVTENKRTKLYHHNNPLVYAWYKPNGLLENGGVWQVEYKYGWEKVAIADSYPGGIIAWVDHLITHEPATVEDLFIELPPIIRSPYHIERWKRQVLAREVDIHRWATAVDAASSEHREGLLDKYFPMSTAEGNCIYPGKCMGYD